MFTVYIDGTGHPEPFKGSAIDGLPAGTGTAISFAGTRPLELDRNPTAYTVTGSAGSRKLHRVATVAAGSIGQATDAVVAVEATADAAGQLPTPVELTPEVLAALATDVEVAASSAAIRAGLKVAAGGPVATQGMINGGAQASNGSNTGMNTKRRHTLKADVTMVRLVFANVKQTGSSGLDPITLSCAIERTSGNYITVTFNGGNPTAVLPNGRRIISDPVPLFLKAGSNFWTRTFVEVTAGQAYPKWALANVYGSWSEATSESVGETSKTNTGTITGSGSGFWPAKIIAAEPIAPTPSVGVIGDSISIGSGSTSDKGYIQNAIYDLVPWINVGVSGEQAQSFASSTLSFRYALLAGCTHIICEFGVNDLDSGRTAANLKTDLIAIWSRFALGGAKVFQTTITPMTTSSDSWATLANQTVKAWEAERVAFNDWLRDGAPMSGTSAAAIGTVGALRAGDAGHPLADYWEVADLVESARNSGKWNAPGWTSDGTHPTTSGHAAMQPAIDTAALLAL